MNPSFEALGGEEALSSLDLALPEAIPWRGSTALVGLCWAIPIPLFSLGIDLDARGQGFAASAVLACLCQHWVHWFALAHLPLFTLVFGIVGGIVDRSERRSRELVEELTRTIDQLEGESTRRAELERAREEMISNFTHELRTPLSSTCAYAEMMLQGRFGPVTPRQARALTVGLKNLRSLEILIDGMLQMARLEAGHITFVQDPFPLGEVLDDVYATVEASAQAKAVHLHRGACDPRIEVLGDREGIRTVLLNLLGNAVKYTETGGEVRIEIETGPRGVASLAIKDTGIGIPEADRPAIFHRFKRLGASRTRKVGGAGLGLAIVKRILDAQGIPISVESEVGKGSTFRFDLPLSPPKIENPGPRASTA